VITVGAVIGLALPAPWTWDAAGVAVVVWVACLITFVATWEPATEPVEPVPVRKAKTVREALTEADAILDKAQQTAKEIVARARQRATETERAAERQAGEIVARARTAAAALDPESERQPRVRPEST
jgi:F0F1-type ATP synthase membrane subunit b/b'